MSQRKNHKQIETLKDHAFLVECFEEWIKETPAKPIITENWQIGVLYEFAEFHQKKKMEKTIDIIALEKERFEWALKIFPKATAISSLRKLEEEISEVEKDINNDAVNSINEEYADCLMCLFDSAGRLGITPKIIFEAFAKKLKINKNREWVQNADNTYSHVK